MAIVKTDQRSTFAHINRGTPFVVRMTLYTRSEGREDPREYIMYKTGRNRAITIDKRTVVHMLSNSRITLCRIGNKVAA